MADFDPFDHFVQNLRRKFFNVSVLPDWRVDLSAFHAPGKIADLLQYIGVEHIMVDPVGLGAYIGMTIMMHTNINICNPVNELFF